MASIGFPHISLINSCICLLYNQLSETQISSFKKGLHSNEFAFSTVNNLPFVQNIAKGIASFYGLPTEAFSVSFNDTLTRPAQVQLFRSSKITVEVNVQHVHSWEDLLAVLAHEMTHIFLNHSRLSFADEHHNEILTDSTATYLGLGTLILNGYTHRRLKIENDTTQLLTRWYGYLTPVEFGYVLAKRAMKFNDNPIGYLHESACDAYYAGQAQLTSEHHLPPLVSTSHFSRWLYVWNRKRAAKRLPSDSSFRSNHTKYGYIFEGTEQLSVIFECKMCSQKLRVPAFRRMRVHCPVCDTYYDCEP